jgi:MOSC domain-containing protein YiiM
MRGTVEQIAIAADESALPGAVGEVEVADRGIVGDRYADAGDITLIEAEAIEAFTQETGIPLTHEESRRQVLTRGIRLGELVGKRFKVGGVVVVGRAGLNADVVAPGRIAVGDEVAGG